MKLCLFQKASGLWLTRLAESAGGARILKLHSQGLARDTRFTVIVHRGQTS